MTLIIGFSPTTMGRFLQRQTIHVLCISIHYETVGRPANSAQLSLILLRNTFVLDEGEMHVGEIVTGP